MVGSLLRLVCLSSAALVLILCGCENPLGGSVEVEYEVTGSAYSVDVTYENSSGSTSREYGVGVPWSHSFYAEPGDHVRITAQNTGLYGTVTVAIYLDGEIYEAETSEGAYCTATASGTL
jgi:hypothetical protein